MYNNLTHDHHGPDTIIVVTCDEFLDFSEGGCLHIINPYKSTTIFDVDTLFGINVYRRLNDKHSHQNKHLY